MPPKKLPVTKATLPVKKAAAPKKKGAKSLYDKPQHMPSGTLVTDLQKNQWIIGNPIGTGGFGEIYSACEANKAPKKKEDYPYAMKIVRIYFIYLPIIIFCIQTIYFLLF